MRHFIPFCLYFLIWVNLTSCNTKKNNKIDSKHTQKISFSDFNNTNNVVFSEFSTAMNGQVLEIAVIDTVLIVLDSYQNPMINIIGINSKKIIGQILFRGRESGQCIQGISIIPSSNKTAFWIHDMTLGKLIKIDYKKVIFNKGYVFDDEIILNQNIRPLRAISCVNDTVFVGTSLGTSDCRIIKFNHKSKILSKIGSLPLPDDDWPTKSKHSIDMHAYIFNAFIANKINTEKYYVAYFNADLLEIYEPNLTKQIDGPIHFKPIQKFLKSQSGVVHPIQIKESLIGYTNIKVTDSFVVCLFSGEDNYQSCGKKLLIYNENGLPIKLININKRTCSMAVKQTNDKLLIYTLEKESGKTFYTTVSIKKS